MNDKDKEILEYNNRFFKKILKSLLFTFFIAIFTFFVLFNIIGLIFSDGDFAFTISFFISIVFTLFYCTMTIIEEIKK